MKFPSPLLPGKLVKRYKRFMADIALDSGETITAHCANSGAMWGIQDPGLPVWVSQVPVDAVRKLRYDWQLVEVDDTLVGVHTHRPNGLVEEALNHKSLPIFHPFTQWKREVKYGTNSRIDFLAYDDQSQAWFLEVKNVHMRRKGTLAEFPDTVTTRGSKHLNELMECVSHGAKAAVIYVVQRDDCTHVSVAPDKDPGFAHMAYMAQEKGVHFWAVSCHMSLEETYIHKILEVDHHYE